MHKTNHNKEHYTNNVCHCFFLKHIHVIVFIKTLLAFLLFLFSNQQKYFCVHIALYMYICCVIYIMYFHIISDCFIIGRPKAKAGEEPGELGLLRSKMLNFLHSSQHYEPEGLVSKFPMDSKLLTRTKCRQWTMYMYYVWEMIF